MSLGGTDLPDYYKHGALNHVSRFFKIPESQQRQASAIVEFRIMRDGRITDIRLKKSCGVASLDQRALEALKNAGRFSPLPDSVRSDTLKHEIEFQMN